MDAALIQSPVVIVTALSLLIAVAALIYALKCWRQRNMKYFAYLTIVVAVNVLGYYLEVTAPTLEAAIVACKVAYLGVPFSGILLFMFSLDYAHDKVALGKLLKYIIFSIAFVFTIAVNLYPWVPIFYQDLAFSTEGLVNHLIVSPGPLYYPCIIFGSLFSILAFVNLIVGFVKEKRYEGAIIFIVAICLPLFTQFYTMIFGLIDGWNPQRTALALSVALLAIYLARYKQARWQSMGRELVVQDMEDAFILLDNKGAIIDNNDSAERYFPQLTGSKKLLKLSYLWEFPQENYSVYGTYSIKRELDGKELSLKVTTSPLEADGEITGTLVVINDDTANNQLLQELTRMARIDDLTGLNNRATFFHDAELSFMLAKREETNKGCALMIDIDYFKTINDTYGHAVGDEVLRFMGALLLRRFRLTDICGRYGGEELSVWMPATSLEGAVQVAEEIRALTEAHVFEAEGSSFNVTISVGIACMRNCEPKDFDELMKKADFALYEAKDTGRNRICTYNNR